MSLLNDSWAEVPSKDLGGTGRVADLGPLFGSVDLSVALAPPGRIHGRKAELT